jgi:hypothetical protein
MASWTGNGGCINGIRFAADGAGQGDRDWLAAVDVAAEVTNAETMILAIAFDSDDMNAISGDFVLEWQDATDADGWNDLASSGELKWGTVSDLVNDNAVVSAERNGSENCSAMGVSHTDGKEREGANDAAMSSVATKLVFDLQWAIDCSGAENNHEYEFRVSESGGGSGVYKTFTAKLTTVTAGKIDGTTKDENRDVAVGSVTVSAYLSDGAGSDPKPIGALKSQVVSHSSTGVYSLTGLVSGSDYFLHFYKDDTEDLSDGSISVTAVDA